MFHVELFNLKMMKKIIRGNLVDVFNKVIYPAEITIADNKIESIRDVQERLPNYILPGLIDSHIHIESSMLTPARFSELAVRHGTVGVVSDPHEIANVIGVEGVALMIENGKGAPLKFFFGAPSCVPATEFETAGGRIDLPDIEKLLQRDDIYFLSEVMNFPDVINGEKEIINKINCACKYSKPVDGHAPGLVGKELKTYIEAGITTDHECIDLKEAEEKIKSGMRIQIREGSAAKGFNIFSGLIERFPDMVMLCSDDLHPDELVNGHINRLLSRGIKSGIDLFKMIRSATLNPVLHYDLPVGLLREGDYADMIIVKDLIDFDILETYIDGEVVFSHGTVLFNSSEIHLENTFRNEHIKASDLELIATERKIKVIEAIDKELFTRCKITEAKIQDQFAVSDPERDICKIVVLNRYRNNRPAVGFISGFGLKRGAIAGSVAHDSHNIIAIGVDDSEIALAINSILEMQGGLAAVDSETRKELRLEIAGLMTNRDGMDVASEYREIENFAKSLGSKLSSPFMTMSFMALLVIPELKIGDKGLFDVNNFNFTPVFVSSQVES
jgi:adenine deaminase